MNMRQTKAVIEFMDEHGAENVYPRDMPDFNQAGGTVYACKTNNERLLILKNGNVMKEMACQEDIAMARLPSPC